MSKSSGGILGTGVLKMSEREWWDLYALDHAEEVVERLRAWREFGKRVMETCPFYMSSFDEQGNMKWTNQCRTQCTFYPRMKTCPCVGAAKLVDVPGPF